MSPARRIVITGLGPVTPLGIGREPFWRSLVRGESGVRPVTRFDTSQYPVRVGGEVGDFDPRRFLQARELRHSSRFAQFAVAAAQLALEDAGLTHPNGRRIGACFASSISGAGDVATDEVPRHLSRGFEAADPWSSNRVTTHFATSLVCQILGLEGPRASMASGCTAGLDVTEWAADRLRAGEADAVVVGATDAPFFPVIYGMLCATGAYSSQVPAPRPFDRSHSGAVVSEGAGAVVVESLDHALARGVSIYAEVVGYGSAGEAADVYRPPIGCAGPGAIRSAVQNARLAADDLDAICPTAPGVPSLDCDDIRSIKAVLGEHAYRIPVPSIQGSVGHMIAASSIIQLTAMALAVKHQMIPPTVNFEMPAPECDLDCVPNRARHSRLRRVMVLARSMSRTCTAMILASPS